MSRFVSLAALASLLATTACSTSEETTDDPVTTRAATPPRAPVVTLDLPSFPPLGPRARVTAVVTGDFPSAVLSTTFRSRLSDVVELRSGVGTVTYDARRLGSGRGTLVVEACDGLRTGCSGTSIENLVVDLAPPELEVERAVASPLASGTSGEIAIWAADDWVLGRVAFTFAGKTLERVFPAAWPSTLGEAWDVSRVAFPARDLPEGGGEAKVVVEDAAGNRLERTLAIRIDGTPPTAAMSAPATGLTVARGAPLAVRASASDPNGGTDPVLEVWVGGARVAELPGPTVDLDVDTTTLPHGPLEVRVVPRDEAGNVGAAVVRTVTVE